MKTFISWRFLSNLSLSILVLIIFLSSLVSQKLQIDIRKCQLVSILTLAEPLFTKICNFLWTHCLQKVSKQGQTLTTIKTVDTVNKVLIKTFMTDYETSECILYLYSNFWTLSVRLFVFLFVCSNTLSSCLTDVKSASKT